MCVKMAFKAMRLNEMTCEHGKRKRNTLTFRGKRNTPTFRGQRYTVKQQMGLKKSNQRDKQKTKRVITWKSDKEIVSRRKECSTMSLIV